MDACADKVQKGKSAKMHLQFFCTCPYAYELNIKIALGTLQGHLQSTISFEGKNLKKKSAKKAKTLNFTIF